MADIPDAGGGDQQNFFSEQFNAIGSGNGRRDLSEDAFNPTYNTIGDHSEGIAGDDQGEDGNPLFDDAYTTSDQTLPARSTDSASAMPIDSERQSEAVNDLSRLYVNSVIEGVRPTEPLGELAATLEQMQRASRGWQLGGQDNTPHARVGYGDYYQGRSQGFNDNCWGTGHQTCPPVESGLQLSLDRQNGITFGVTFGNGRFHIPIPHYSQHGRRQGN
ncbi:MAG: hypothetical protein K2Z81_14860 [Cyanobacteria bacterium]|nr:hypothetical protein [Cyanobacteriota bacterium]